MLLAGRKDDCGKSQGLGKNGFLSRSEISLLCNMAEAGTEHIKQHSL